MSITSASLWVTAEELRLYSSWLDGEAVAFETAISRAGDAREAVRDGWKGPLPDLVDQSISAYLDAIGEASAATTWIAAVVGNWGSFASQLAGDLEAAERYAASFAELRVTGAGFGGVHSEQAAAWSQVHELEQSWDPACSTYIGQMDSALRALAKCKDATATNLPVPPHLLTGTGYLATIGQLVYFYNYPGGVTPDPEDPLTFEEVDPELQALADSQADEAKDSPWIFTAYETANDGDIDEADNNGEWEDLMSLTSWDVAERQVRQMNEQLGWALSDAEIASRTEELMAFAWLSLGRITNEGLAGDVEALEDLEGDEWVDPEMEDLAESDTSHEASLNPFVQLQDVPWTDLTQDQRRLLHILQPWLTDPNRGVTWAEWCDGLGPLKLIVDPSAVLGSDATWFSRTLEGIGVVPFGKVFRWSDEVIDLIRGVENATDAGRVAETTADVVVHGDEFAEGATELVGVSDEGITTFDNVAVDAGDSATETVDEVLDRVDQSAHTSGADDTAETLDDADDPSAAVDDPADAADGDHAGDSGDDPAEQADDAAEQADGNSAGDAEVSGPEFTLDDPLDHMSDEMVVLSEQHLTDSGETVIGPYEPTGGGPSYIEVAQEEGASYFDIGDAWNDATPTERLAANQHFLDTAIENKDAVYLSIDPRLIDDDTYTAAEIRYLLENGYVWVDDNTLAPAGG